MSTDDKKTSPAPKNGAVEKKAVDADRSKAESGEKTADSPTSYSRGEGQKPAGFDPNETSSWPFCQGCQTAPLLLETLSSCAEVRIMF